MKEYILWSRNNDIVCKKGVVHILDSIIVIHATVPGIYTVDKAYYPNVHIMMISLRCNDVTTV